MSIGSSFDKGFAKGLTAVKMVSEIGLMTLIAWTLMLFVSFAVLFVASISWMLAITVIQIITYALAYQSGMLTERYGRSDRPNLSTDPVTNAKSEEYSSNPGV